MHNKVKEYTGKAYTDICSKIKCWFCNSYNVACARQCRYIHIILFRIVGIDGISSGIDGTTTSFVPPRFAPCLVSGLAYYIAMKRPEVANRVAAIKTRI